MRALGIPSKESAAWLLQGARKQFRKLHADIAESVTTLSVDADAERPGSLRLTWHARTSRNVTLEIEEQSTGVITTLDRPRSPLVVDEILPEGYYDARLRVGSKLLGRQITGKLQHFSTLQGAYFEDRNPRPKHILSMDEGNKFQHSRMFRVLNVVPGQALPPHPQFHWLTTIEGVNAFDLALFNKQRSYWAFLRGIRNNNAMPADALEPGEWFLFVKASRDQGQIWSFPLYFVVETSAVQEQDSEGVVVRPKYMDGAGEYFTKEVPDRRTSNRNHVEAGNWLFKPTLVGQAGLRPTIKWTPVQGAETYELHFIPKNDNAEPRRYRDIETCSLTVPDALSEGSYDVAVHAFATSPEKHISRRIRSARLSLQVTEAPSMTSYRAMEKTLLRKLEREKAFAEHMDAVANLDYYTNIKLKRWEIENGVTKLLSLPTKLTTLVGYNCNIDCHFCDNGRVPRDIRIPPKFIDDLAYFMPFARTMQVLGGEPLMLKDFRRICDVAKNQPHLELATTTNGTLVDDEWAYYFARSNFSQVWMSVDGASEAVYQSMRRGGTLTSVVDGVKKIVAYGSEAPAVCWSFIVSKRNYHEIIDYYKLARDLGIRSIFYKMLQLRFGPNYPGVGRLDTLMDRDVCARVMADLATVRDMAEQDGIEFDERVVSYVRHVHPDLAEDFLTPQIAVADAEIEGGDEVFSARSKKNLPPPQRGDARQQEQLLDRLIGLHRDLKNDAFEGIPLEQRAGDQLCQLPFAHLGLNGTNAYMCCYAGPKVLPVSFEADQEHLTDVWNSQRYQFSRESFFRRRVDDACLGTCPYRKQEGDLWITGMLSTRAPTVS